MYSQIKNLINIYNNCLNLKNNQKIRETDLNIAEAKQKRGNRENGETET